MNSLRCGLGFKFGHILEQLAVASCEPDTRHAPGRLGDGRPEWRERRDRDVDVILVAEVLSMGIVQP